MYVPNLVLVIDEQKVYLGFENYTPNGFPAPLRLVQVTGLSALTGQARLSAQPDHVNFFRPKSIEDAGDQTIMLGELYTRDLAGEDVLESQLIAIVTPEDSWTFYSNEEILDWTR